MNTSQKILISGAHGQLGWELQRSAPARFQLVAIDRETLDITDSAAVSAFITLTRPDLIINAAAFTAVDKAEQEPAAAFAVNRDGVAHLAQAAAETGARLIHVSTDFVFDGRQSHPYRPGDAPNPLNVYGASKLAGELAVQSVLGDDATIIRTAWVYSAHGRNFVKTILRHIQEREQLGVVSDQVGTPTWAAGLASAIWQIADLPQVKGILHWTDAGVASWYDFAVAIQEEAANLGMLARRIPVRPIASSDYPTPAKRPAYSVLDKTTSWKSLGRMPGHWRESLRLMLHELRQTRD